MEILNAKICGSTESLIAATANGFPISKLLSCDLVIILKIVLRIAMLLSWIRGSVRTPRKTTDVVNFIPEVGRILSGWPGNFFVFCGTWKRFQDSRAKASASFFMSFNWLFTHLYKNSREKKIQVLFLIEVAVSYGYRHWRGKPIEVRSKGLRSLCLPPRRFGTWRDAVKSLGVPKYTIFRWLSQGRLPATARGVKRNRPTWLVDLDALMSVHVSSRPGFSLRDAARFIGVPHSTYSELRKRGEIPSNHLTDFRSTAAYEDLVAFKKSIVSRAERAPPGVVTFRLGDFLLANAPSGTSTKSQVLLDIRDGKIWVCLKGPPSISNLHTKEDLLESSRARARAVGEKMSLHQGLIKYGLSYYEMKAICLHVAAGGRATKTAHWAVQSEKVESFMSKYELLRVVARDMGTKGDALREFLEGRMPDALLQLDSGRVGGKRYETTIDYIERRYIEHVVELAESTGFQTRKPTFSC